MYLPIRSRLVFVFSTALLALVLLAACGDDGGGGNGSPTITPPENIGEGDSPLAAIAPILLYEGLGGHFLDEQAQVSCPLEEVIETPGVASRIDLGQFCLTLVDYNPEEGGTLMVENKIEGGVWAIRLTFDGEIWKVRDIEQVSE